MTDKDKYRAKIEAELVKFGKSIEELEQEAERQQDKFDAYKRAHIEDIKKQKAHAEARLREMDQAEEEKRPGILKELQGYVKDIDDNLREALSYLAY